MKLSLHCTLAVILLICSPYPAGEAKSLNITPSVKPDLLLEIQRALISRDNVRSFLDYLTLSGEELKRDFPTGKVPPDCNCRTLLHECL